jgi:aerobic C4-dicarboxylate transport protein
MSEARAVTNFTGNAVATVLIGTWTRQYDAARGREVLGGRVPFDESLLTGDPHGAAAEEQDRVGGDPVGEPAVDTRALDAFRVQAAARESARG